METKYLRYSHNFKMMVVKEHESGGSMGALKRKYGIKGSATITRWVKELGKFESLPIRITVENHDEVAKLKALEAEVKKLKLALADAYLDKAIDKAVIEIACEKLGVKPEELKKKVDDESLKK
jgi:transposase-like protein